MHHQHAVFPNYYYFLTKMNFIFPFFGLVIKTQKLFKNYIFYSINERKNKSKMMNKLKKPIRE